MIEKMKFLSCIIYKIKLFSLGKRIQNRFMKTLPYFSTHNEFRIAYKVFVKSFGKS